MPTTGPPRIAVFPFVFYCNKFYFIEKQKNIISFLARQKNHFHCSSLSTKYLYEQKFSTMKVIDMYDARLTYAGLTHMTHVRGL